MVLPRVSVVIPVRNCEAYLGEAIDSVLCQSLPPAEVIVVDDGSSDQSAEIAASFGSPVQLLSRMPGGLAPAARNAGVRRATGELLAFLDADDTWATDRLAHQVEVLDAPGAPDLIFGNVEEFHSPELSGLQRRGLPQPRGIVAGRVITTLLVSRQTFDAVGPFDERLPAADFLDWLARARSRGLREVMLDEVVAHRRVHPANTQWTSRQSDVIGALRASLHRRAAAEQP